MVKSIRFFALAAASALAMFSCQRVEMEEQTPKGVEYVFALGNADDTKATIAESVVWDSGDRLGTFTPNSHNSYSNITAATADTPASFSIYSQGGLAVNDMIYCYYPYSASAGNDKTAVKMSIPTAQNEKDAMPMASIPYKVTEASANNQTSYAGKIQFVNLGAVVELNIYSTSYADETVTSVEFQADQAIAGDFDFDLTGVDYSDKSTLAVTGYSEKTVTYTPAAPLAVGSSKADATIVNLVVAPGSYTGKIVVYTDKAVYTYPITTAKQFDRSVAKPLGVNLREDVRSNYPSYAFALATEIAVGDKVMFASAAVDGKVYVMGVQDNNNRKTVQSQVSGNTIVAVGDMAVFTVGKGTLKPEYYTFYDSVEEGYLYAASSKNNYLRTKAQVDTTSEWNVSWTDGVPKIIADGMKHPEEYRNWMRFNNTNNALFSCYASGQEDVYIYKMTDATSVGVVSVPEYLTYEAGVATVEYTLANPKGITIVTPGENVNVVSHNESARTIEFNYSANTTNAPRTLTLTIVNNEATIAVSILQKPAPVKLVMSEVTATPAETNISYTWNAVDGAVKYQVNKGSMWEDVTGTSYAYGGLTAATEYTVSFRAVGDGVDYLTSDAVSSTATTNSAGTSVYYEKVTSITSGKKYLLVAEMGNNYYVFNSASVQTTMTGIDLTGQVDNNRIAESDAVNLYSVVITQETDGYKIQLSNGNYLIINKTTGSNGNLTSSSEGELLSVTESDGRFLFTSTNRNSRSLIYRGSTYNCFKNYATSNATAKDYCGYLTLYEYTGN